jgi:hypothetical protein
VFALVLAAALFAAPRAAADEDRLTSCPNSGVQSVCVDGWDAVAGSYTASWPGSDSTLEKLLNCVPVKTAGTYTCVDDEEGVWPLYHAVGKPSSSDLVPIKPPVTDLTKGNNPRHTITVKEAKYSFIGDAACTSLSRGCTYVWAGPSHTYCMFAHSAPVHHCRRRHTACCRPVSHVSLITFDLTFT